MELGITPVQMHCRNATISETAITTGLYTDWDPGDYSSIAICPESNAIRLRTLDGTAHRVTIRYFTPNKVWATHACLDPILTPSHSPTSLDWTWIKPTTNVHNTTDQPNCFSHKVPITKCLETILSIRYAILTTKNTPLTSGSHLHTSAITHSSGSSAKGHPYDYYSGTARTQTHQCVKCKDGASHDTIWTVDRNMPRTITFKCQANILNTKGGRLDTILYPDEEAPITIPDPPLPWADQPEEADISPTPWKRPPAHTPMVTGNHAGPSEGHQLKIMSKTATTPSWQRWEVMHTSRQCSKE